MTTEDSRNRPGRAAARGGGVALGTDPQEIRRDDSCPCRIAREAFGIDDEPASGVREG